MNNVLAVLPVLTLLTCHSQELAVNTQGSKTVEPICPWTDARFLPEAQGLRQLCSDDHVQEIEKARLFIQNYRGVIAAALTARCLESSEFPCPTESYEVLSQEGSQALYFCTKEPLRLETTDGTVLDEYAGVTLGFRGVWTAGSYTLDDSAFRDFCDTVDVVAHEEAHVTSGIQHRYENCELNRNDWVTAVGEEAGRLCRKTMEDFVR